MRVMSNNPLILDAAVAEGLDVIGDRWSLLILREAFSGHHRFEALVENTGASRSTLSRRLKALVDSGVFYKHQNSGRTDHAEYRFTDMGMELLGASLLAHAWDARRSNADAQRPWPYHIRCQHRLEPLTVCRHCREEVHFKDVHWVAAEQRFEGQMAAIRAMHSQRRVRESRRVKADPEDLVYLIGDRWTLLILIAAFFGVSRYHAFQEQLSISPNLLSERLKALVRGDIMTRTSYQQNPPRHAYHLSDKGLSIFPFIMALRQWAIDNSRPSQLDTSLVHGPCGQTLAVDIVCAHCREKPWPRDIGFERQSDTVGRI